MLYTFKKALRYDLGADIGADWASPTFTLKADGVAVDLDGYEFELLLFDKARGERIEIEDVDVEFETEIHSPTTDGKVHFTLARATLAALPKVEMFFQVFSTTSGDFKAKVIEGDFNLFFGTFPTPQP